ncbi:response regulator [Paludibacterium purpuratum]|uniref:Two-component system response regulator QseB n=1 Tax=Paludibacterium purpuratum TaxID=1144873 RepID=A0A4R7B3R3_9NEIS|nr:response regulator [Paludibacterium purpuratum]TDR76660.1 two-component system response regulator QseB [Paludibacterium purpuratum]
MRILVVEDDPLIGDGLKAGLAQLGFAVDWLNSGKDALYAMGAAPYDAAVLDLGLPGCDGMTVLESWRRQGHNLPVLVLTARDAIGDRVAGLDAGADDYLIKPFALIEVAARLRAMLRRSQGLSSHLLSHGDVSFDPAARCAYLREHPVELTARELAILEVLLLNKGRVLPRELIEEKLYNWERDLESNAIEVHIHHLRKKLGRHVIRTVRGIGYTLGRVE